MKLSHLLQGITVMSTTGGDADCEITGITNDSRQVQQGALYVAIQGAQLDGHHFAADALKLGAACVIVERDLGISSQVVVVNSKQAYAVACANWFAHPAREMTLIAVTGTNGKTSTTSMIRAILERAGHTTGLMGTISVSYGDVVKETPHTTPDAYLFQKTLREMATAGCSHVVLEASSMALVQQRLYGTRFAVCVFTNLSPDHLDYHPSMEAYFAAKATLFPMGEAHLVNLGDPYGKRLKEQLGAACRTFALEQQSAPAGEILLAADFYATEIVCRRNGVSFQIALDGERHTVSFAIPGRYSAENALAALGACRMLGVPMTTITAALGEMAHIRGRCEVLYQSDILTVIGDYAHTPDGIKNILQTLREIASARLVAVFGCGGDRDPLKRPLMAQAAGAYADLVIVTSDNPRSENPEHIIEEILTGRVPGVKYLVIPDRTKAIEHAMQQAEPHDLVVLLGKGHETYQVLKQGKIHYDEREIVAVIAERQSPL